VRKFATDFFRAAKRMMQLRAKSVRRKNAAKSGIAVWGVEAQEVLSIRRAAQAISGVSEGPS
jgi:hypothetical protein